MSTNQPNVVILRGTDELEYKERPAAEEIRPGHLLEYSGGQVQLHSTAGDPAAPIFAIVNRKRGMLADDPDGEHDSYAAGETVLYVNADDGYQFHGLLAAGQTVQDGTLVTSDGAGGFRTIDTAAGETSSAAVAQAIETVDNSGGTEAARFRLEVL